MRVLPRLFKLWPWIDLDLFYIKVKFGYIGFCMGESEFFLLETLCSLRSQSRLKHSAKWVNEVEWVSKVNVILWTGPKVIQISKLNVWLLACILRWAIQGLMALLFFLPKQTQRSRSIFQDESRSLGLFRKGKIGIIAKFHRTDLVIWSHSRGTKKNVL